MTLIFTGVFVLTFALVIALFIGFMFLYFIIKGLVHLVRSTLRRGKT